MASRRRRSAGFSLLEVLVAFVILALVATFVGRTSLRFARERKVSDAAWREQRPVMSPDGRYIVYVSDESREQEF